MHSSQNLWGLDSCYVLCLLQSIHNDSLSSLSTSININELRISAAITKFNIHTGNGRLLIEGENETKAFGFRFDYKFVNYELKKIFTKNLDKNNGLADENKIYLQLRTHSLIKKNANIVKYLIVGALE